MKPSPPLASILEEKLDKNKKLTKIVKIEKVKFISSERLDKFQWNCWEKCNLWWYSVTEKQSFTLSSDSIFFEIYS